MPNIERHFIVAAGQKRAAGSLTLGQFDENDPESKHQLRKLRLFPLQPYIERYEAFLTVPGGVTIGPIDIPLTFNIETPVHIMVTNDTAPSSKQDIVGIISDQVDAPNLYGATYLVQVPALSSPPLMVAIPDGVVAVTIYDGATATFYDSTSTAICFATGPFLVARPRFAKFISANASIPSALLFHY